MQRQGVAVEVGFDVKKKQFGFGPVADCQSGCITGFGGFLVNCRGVFDVDSVTGCNAVESVAHSCIEMSIAREANE